MTGLSSPRQSSTQSLTHQGVSDSAAPLRRLGGNRVRGLYVHVPFCFHKCHYCDFYSIVDDGDRQAAFTDRLITEARVIGALTNAPPHTIFVGGGTPTLLAADHWRRLLDALHDAFDFSALTEFTVEANPETVTAELLDVLVAGGVNRVSVGAQTFTPTHLQTLERWHDPANVARAVDLARAAGVDNVNLDLIFAIPGQTLDDWLADLATALSLRPTHLSCYSLMFEPNTPLTKKLELGRIDRCDNDLEAAMFNATIDTLCGNGFEHYEVSNFARPGRRCEHNLLYWLNDDWAAIGPSASGHVQGLRWKNAPHLGKYLATTGPCPIEQVEQLDADASLGEQLMLRLRLIDGVEHAWLDAHLGDRPDDRRRAAIDAAIDAGQLERTDTHVRLTRAGLMVADDVFAELL